MLKGVEAELLGVVEAGDFYEVVISMEGQEIPLYITKDGNMFTSQLVDLNEDFSQQATQQDNAQQATQQATQQGPIDYTDADLEKIGVFMNCLADKGVKIYGANWCGWTKKFVVETLGGFDVAAPVYIECTEKEAECSDAGVSGYPTTKINGEAYSGARTIAGLADATGCQAPDIEGIGELANINADAEPAAPAAGCGA